MTRKTVSFAVCALIFCAAFLLFSAAYAGDQEAMEHFKAGREYEKAGKFSSAASEFMSAQLQADDPVLKSNALMDAARAYRKNKQYGSEFDCLERLVKEHLNRINFTNVVEREYEIGDAFFAGHRDIAFSWLPFLKKDDRSIEIYEAALKNAPCSEKAPNARLKLGRLYLDGQNSKDAIRHFNETIKLYPDTEAAKFASLELCSTYLQLSRRGDGDNAFGKQAIEAFDHFLAKYPKDSECAWVRRAKEEVKGNIATRLKNIGNYYERSGQKEIAENYLARVIRDYPATESAVEAEKSLAKIDQTYKPEDSIVKKPYTPPERKFSRMGIPEEDASLITVPENSNGKWLLPVRDIKKKVKYDSSERKQEEGKVKDEDI